MSEHTSTGNGFSTSTSLASLLQIQPGITCVIGSGGKTTMLQRLSQELSQRGTVLLATSTHFFPFRHCPVITTAPEAVSPEELRETISLLLETGNQRILCVGAALPESATSPQDPEAPAKLTAPPISFPELARLADYVLVEADGSKRLPLKAHAQWEPVIPPETRQRILVVGASGIGQPIAEAVHRPQLFLERMGDEGAEAAGTALATPERVAAVLNEEALADVVFLNQLDRYPEPEKLLAAFRRLLSVPVCGGSLQSGRYFQ